MNFKASITNMLAKANIIELPNLDEKVFSASQGFGGGNPFAIFQTGRKKSASKAMRQYSGWVYAAVRAIAEEVASIELKLYKATRTGAQQVEDHPILDVLNGMNPYQPSYEVLYNTVAHLIMSGNAYWYLGGMEEESSKPKEIYLLPVEQVAVVRGSFPELIREYKFRDGAVVHTYKRHQIMHFRLPDPSDAASGAGVVESIAQWIDADNYATEFNRRFFINGARLAGFLESEHAHTREQLEYLQKAFEQVYAGVQNAYKVAALPKGTKYKEGQATQKDLDFNEGQKVSRDKILAGFRVPKTILGAAEGDTNRATAETADYVFVKRTVRPLVRLIVIWLNEFFVPKFGDEEVYLDFDDPTPKDKEQEVEELKAVTGGQPIVSVNEARDRYLDMPPVDGGDEIRGNSEMKKVATVDKKILKSNKTKIKTSLPKTRYSLNAKNRKKMSEDVAEAITKQLKETFEQRQKEVADMSDDEFEVVWKALIDRNEPYEEAMEKAVQEYNDKQLETVLGNLDEAVKAVNSDALYEIEEWTNALVEVSLPIVSEVYEQEAKQAAELLGFDDVTGLTEEAREGLQKGMELMARKYNETTIEMLKSKLEEALEDGMAFDDIKNLVKEIYEFSNEVRAKQVARSEIFRAANYATKNAWRETGVVKTVKWYTAADERVCEFCGPQHGKVIDIDKDFYKLGDTVEGEDGSTLKLNYSDIGHPPLHVSCRCYIRPETIDI